MNILAILLGLGNYLFIGEMNMEITQINNLCNQMWHCPLDVRIGHIQLSIIVNSFSLYYLVMCYGGKLPLKV
jgi:hypothetical protein